MKKCLSCLLVLLVLMLLPMFVIEAQAAETSGTCGENLTWVYDADTKTLTISGTGEMQDFYWDGSDRPYHDYAAEIEAAVIADGVTTIGKYAFLDCYSLASVTIPEGVTSIGSRAFYGCSTLTNVTIPEGVTSIGGSAFEGCSSLASVTIPEGVTSIGTTAFYGCSSLTCVTIPDSVTSIYYGTFSDCYSLTNVTIPDSITSIGDNAFSWCRSLTSVTIPGGVTSIGRQAFYYCDSLISVTIPDSVTSIGDDAFTNCLNLDGIWVDENNPNYSSDDRGVLFDKSKSLLMRAPYAMEGHYSIPGSVTSIGGMAFYYCDSLTNVTIPDSVTSIGEGAFSYCESLTSVTISDRVISIDDNAFTGCDSLDGIWVDENNPNYSSDDHGVLFDKNKSRLIQAPPAMEGHYSVPGGVTSIGAYAISFCDNLTSVTIPDSVTYIDSYAFLYCGSLDGIWVDENNSNYSSDDRGVLFDKNKYLLMQAPAAMEGHYSIPGSVTSIAYFAFDECRYLTSVVIPEGMTSIGHAAFSDCVELSTIQFTGDAPSIGEFAFYRVITNAYYPKDNTTWSEEVMQSYGGYITWIPMCAEHSWGEWSVVTEATATAAGEKIRVCGACGWEETEVIPATGEPVTPPVDDEPVTPPVEDDKPIENPFMDVFSTDYYYDPVLWAVENGITTGMTENTFVPDGTCTRAQIVTFLWRANGSPAPAAQTNPFTDVPAGQWYTDAVLWAVEQGITTGTSATTFSPDASCTRGQVATFLYRAQGKPASSGTNIFTDLEAGAYYYDAVLWAVENGITNGMGDGTFAPDATCTRGQIVTFLYRAMT